MSVAITNIGSLVTNDPNLGSGILGELENATLVIENEKTYLSEKLFNALLAGCIPIYIGPELTKFKLPRGIAIEIHEPLAETILTRTTELSEESALVMIENIQNFLKDPVASPLRIRPQFP